MQPLCKYGRFWTSQLEMFFEISDVRQSLTSKKIWQTLFLRGCFKRSFSSFQPLSYASQHEQWSYFSHALTAFLYTHLNTWLSSFLFFSFVHLTRASSCGAVTRTTLTSAKPRRGPLLTGRSVLLEKYVCLLHMVLHGQKYVDTHKKCLDTEVINMLTS